MKQVPAAFGVFLLAAAVSASVKAQQNTPPPQDAAAERAQDLDEPEVVGLAIGGVPAVLVAAFIVKTMPLELLRWLVIVVVLYAAAIMAHAAWKGRREHKAEAATAAVTA